MIRELSVVADKAIPWLQEHLNPVAHVTYLPGADIRSSHLAGCDALLIRTRTKCNSSLLQKTPVSFIGTATIGTDHIDTLWCSNAGIEVVNAPGCNSGSVMQYIIAALLQICLIDGRETNSYTLGIIGAGHIGSKVAKSAKAIGMKTLISDPPRERREGSAGFTSLRRLVAESDIITLHVPLTLTGNDKTLHLAGKEFIQAMKPGSWLINSSRGDVVGEDNVKRAIDRRVIAGYVADVWKSEPQADRELVDMATLATPHTAGYSTDGKLNGTKLVLEGLSKQFGIAITLPDTSLLPAPAKPTINVALNSTLTEQLNSIVTHTFDILTESLTFKSNPSLFEQLRNNYPSRREFNAYHIEHEGVIKEIAQKLGFII